MLWATGARPIEVLEMKRSDIGVEEHIMKFRMKNHKIRVTKEHFQTEERTVTFKRGNYWIEQIIRLITPIPPDAPLLKCKRIRYAQVMGVISMKALGMRFSAYHLRHSSTSLLFKSGLSITEVMALQGRFSAQSLYYYTHATPSLIDMDAQNRSGSMEAKPHPKAFPPLPPESIPIKPEGGQEPAPILQDTPPATPLPPPILYYPDPPPVKKKRKYVHHRKKKGLPKKEEPPFIPDSILPAREPILVIKDAPLAIPLLPLMSITPQPESEAPYEPPPQEPPPLEPPPQEPPKEPLSPVLKRCIVENRL
jgi:hypothetical protein